MPNPNFLAFIVFDISAFIRTGGQADEWTWLEYISRIYILYRV